jgi:cytochrome P450
MITDPAEHARRRKLWARAFTPAALVAYEPKIIERTGQLCRIIDSHDGAPFDLKDLIARATFDMMGDFAYGGAFELMADGDPSNIVSIIHQGSAAIDLWATVPWVRPLLQLIPVKGMKMFFATSLGVAERRRAAGSKIRDLFHYLVRSVRMSNATRTDAWQTDEDGEDGRPQFSPTDLAMEASLPLIAGSETTSSTLLNTIFYLVAFPKTMEKLRAELDAAAGLVAADIEPAVLAKLPYLQAVMQVPSISLELLVR